jgi:hypothetical protein
VIFHHGIEVVTGKLRRGYREVRDLDRPRLGLSDREVAESLWKSGQIAVAGEMPVSPKRGPRRCDGRPHDPKELLLR